MTPRLSSLFLLCACGARLTALPTAAPDGAASAIVLAPARDYTADGVDGPQVLVTARDSAGNPLAAQAVSLSASGGGNTFDAAAGETDTSGLFLAHLASTVAGTKTLTALIGAASVHAQATFLPGPPSHDASTFTAAPALVTADGQDAAILHLLLRDARGNAIAGAAVSLSGPGTLQPASGATGAGGDFSATWTSTAPGAATVTASAGGATFTASVQFAPTGPAPGTSTLTVGEGPWTADGADGPQVQIVARDASGNALSGQAVVLSVSGEANAFAASGATAADGSFSTRLTSTHAELKQIAAQVGGLELDAAALFVAGAISVPESTFTTGVGTVLADGRDPGSLTLLARDAQGNPIAGALVVLTVSGAGAAVEPASGTTDAGGVFTAVLTGTEPGEAAVTATVGGAAFTTTVLVQPAAADASASTLEISPAQVAADGVAAAGVRVTLRDVLGNPLAGRTVSLSANGSDNQFDAASGATGSDGAFAASLRSTTIENKTVTALADGLTLTRQVQFVALPPDAAHSALTATPSQALADGAAAITLTFTARDRLGRAVPGFSVSFLAGGSANSLLPSSGVTGDDGSLTSAFTSTRAEVKHVTAALGLAEDVTFVPGPPDAAHSALTGPSAPLASDGLASAQFLLVLRDAHDNAIGGEDVALAADGSGNSLSAPPATGADGSMQFSLTSTAAGTKTVSAAAGGLTLTAPVTFASDLPSARTSTLTASPATLLADGRASTTLTLTVRDATGAGVAGVAASFAVTGAENTLQPASASTGSGGAATATLSSLQPETKTASATAWGFTLQTPVTFTAPPWMVAQTGIYGGDVYALAFDPRNPGVVYAGGTSFVYRSGDGGQNWSDVPMPYGIAIETMAVDSINSDLYLGGFGSILVSSDGGRSWTPSGIDTGGGVAVAGIVASGGTVMLAANDGSVWRSTDRGVSYSKLPAGLGGWTWRFAADSNGRLYAATRTSGVLVSSDGGGSWSTLGAGLSGEVRSLSIALPRLYAVTGSEAVYVSADSGAHWSLSGAGAYGTRIAADPNHPLQVYTGDGSAFFRSSDGGATWAQTSDISLPTNEVLLAVDPSSGEAYIAGRPGIWRSDDQGGSWLFSSAGIQQTWAVSAAFDSGSLEGAVAIVEDQLIYTTDGGLSWRSGSGGSVTDTPSYVLADPAAQGVFYALYPNDTVYRSTDGGASWAPSGSQRARLLDLHGAVRSGGSVLYGFDFAAGAVLRSKDQGATWSSVLQSPDSLVVCKPGDASVVYVFSWGNALGLYLSRDGGATWAASRPALSQLPASCAVDPGNPAVVYAVQNSTVVRTGDSGVSWTDVTPSGFLSGQEVVVDPANGAHLFTSSPLRESTNAGASWTLLSNDAWNWTYVDAIALSPLDSRRLLVGTQSAGLWRSVTGGR